MQAFFSNIWVQISFVVFIIIIFIGVLSRSKTKGKRQDNATGVSAKKKVAQEPLTSHQLASLKRDKKHAFKKKTTKTVGSVSDWLVDCTSQVSDKEHYARRKECRESYIRWCNLNSYVPIGARVQIRQMRSHLKCNDRDDNGAIFPGLKIR